MKLRNRGHWGHLQVSTLANNVEQVVLTYILAHIQNTVAVEFCMGEEYIDDTIINVNITDRLSAHKFEFGR